MREIKASAIAEAVADLCLKANLELPRDVADALARFRAVGLPVRPLTEPMRWSEDFGWLSKAVPGVYFGIGAGEHCPGLHTEAYEFDDALIQPGVRAFEALL